MNKDILSRCDKPSTVVICLPASRCAFCTHDLVALPSMMTVQVPHAPSLQPSLTDFRRKSFLKISINLRSGSTAISFPLTQSLHNSIGLPHFLHNPYAMLRMYNVIVWDNAFPWQPLPISHRPCKFILSCNHIPSKPYHSNMAIDCHAFIRRIAARRAEIFLCKGPLLPWIDKHDVCIATWKKAAFFG